MLKRGYPPTLDEAGLSFPSSVTITSHRVGNTDGDKTFNKKVGKARHLSYFEILNACAEERGRKGITGTNWTIQNATTSAFVGQVGELFRAAQRGLQETRSQEEV
jgi:hypothetical protein